jgi:hypothetical protein
MNEFTPDKKNTNTLPQNLRVEADRQIAPAKSILTSLRFAATVTVKYCAIGNDNNIKFVLDEYNPVGHVGATLWELQQRALTFYAMAKPGPRCSICSHPRVALINLALCNLVSRDVIAERFGVEPHAVWRHGRNHLTPAARAAIIQAHRPSVVDLDELKRVESESLIGQIIAQRARLKQLITECHEAGDTATVVKAESVVNQNMQLSARLLGQLINVTEHRHSTLVLHPDWVAARSALMAALRPFPEAAAAVAAALGKIEAVSAADMAKAEPERPPRPEPPMLELKAAPPGPPPPFPELIAS